MSHSDRYLDLLQQGFMKSPKKKRKPPRNKHEVAAEIAKQTGADVWYSESCKKFVLPMAAGHCNYIGQATEAKKVAAMAVEYGTAQLIKQ